MNRFDVNNKNNNNNTIVTNVSKFWNKILNIYIKCLGHKDLHKVLIKHMMPILESIN